MSTESLILTLAKAGNHCDENEDWIHVVPPRGKYLIELAVSDGATEASFSREWARTLSADSDWSRLFSRPRKSRNAARWLRDARTEFEQYCDVTSLPWYARAKVQRGTFATFLAFRLTSELWHAAAVGDTCVMQFTGYDPLPKCSFPIDKFDAFSNRPALLASKGDFLRQPVAFVKRAWSLGDVFVCATDAVSAWLIDPAAVSENRICLLTNCRNHTEFQLLVESERAAGRMRNDDSTAIIIRTGGACGEG